MAFLFVFTIFTVVFDVKTTNPAVVVATGVTADASLTISKVILCSTASSTGSSFGTIAIVTVTASSTTMVTGTITGGMSHHRVELLHHFWSWLCRGSGRDRDNRNGTGTGTGGRGGRARNDLVNGQRSVRCYSGSNNYCWSCGFDIKHNSENCEYKKEGHNKSATITNRMGESDTNCFHYFMNQN